MKKTYLLPQFEIIAFEAQDSITISLTFINEALFENVATVEHDAISSMFNAL